MKKLTFALLCLSLMLPLFGQTITCSGSTTVLPIAQATAEAFMDKYPQINISVRGGGSGVGIAALQNGTVHIANSSRKIKSKELSAAKASGIDPRGYAVANDGIAMVLHPSNKVKALTTAQIKDIYTGKVKNWQQLGGDKIPIVIISRDVASGSPGRRQSGSLSPNAGIKQRCGKHGCGYSRRDRLRGPGLCKRRGKSSNRKWHHAKH
jgi:phosphate transport system substrate-binding protein